MCRRFPSIVGRLFSQISILLSIRIYFLREKIKKLNADYKFEMNHSILTAELPDENMTQLISQLFKLDTPKSFTVEELPVEDTMKAFFADPTEFI